MSDLKEDIGYVRRLVEDGQRGPILGGLFLASAGIVFGLTCFIQWADIRGYLPKPFPHNSHLWSIASAFYTVLWLVLYYQQGGFQRRCSQPAGTADRNFGKVWAGMALAVLVAVGTMATAVHITQDRKLFYLMAPIVFVLYGMSWCVSAALLKRRWMYLVSAASYILALLLAFCSGSIAQLAVMGVALLLTLGVPGLYLMREKA